MTSTRTPQPTAHRRSERPGEHRPAEHKTADQRSSERGTEETVQRPAPTPIYSALARQWAAEHRAVPGDVDQEWTALVDYATWCRRQPRTRPTEL